MWFFYPSEFLPQEIDLILLERIKLDFYGAQLWYLIEGTDLIRQTRDDNESHVLHGTRMCYNGVIQPLRSRYKATEWISSFIVVF